VCLCIYSGDTAAYDNVSTLKSEDDQPIHVPLYLLPDFMKHSKPFQSWDPYTAGDLSTRILQDYWPQASSHAHHTGSRDNNSQSAAGTEPIAELIRREFELLRLAPPNDTHPHWTIFHSSLGIFYWKRFFPTNQVLSQGNLGKVLPQICAMIPPPEKKWTNTIFVAITLGHAQSLNCFPQNMSGYMLWVTQTFP